MDDDVQALDTPLSHINGGSISFVVPDPDSNSSGIIRFPLQDGLFPRCAPFLAKGMMDLQ